MYMNAHVHHYYNYLILVHGRVKIRGGTSITCEIGMSAFIHKHSIEQCIVFKMSWDGHGIRRGVHNMLPIIFVVWPGGWVYLKRKIVCNCRLNAFTCAFNTPE